MVHQYIERKLSRKNRGVYFKKGKWILHLLSFLLIWVANIGKLSDAGAASSMNSQSLLAGLLILLPFSVFFYFYCLYLIPSCFKKNRFMLFWIILVLSLLIFPLLHISFQKLLEPYFNVLLTNRSKLSTGQYITETYVSFIFNFMGFTSMLYFMELMEHIRTAKDTRVDINQLAITESHLAKTHMNPEFMTRSLDKIILLAEQQNTATPQAIINFADVLRYRLYRSTKDAVPLQEEIQHLHNLFDFQNRALEQENYAILEIEGNQELKLITPLSLINIAEILLVADHTRGTWSSLLFYILIEDQDIQIAIELTTENEIMVQDKLQTIQTHLQRLWDTPLIFTVEKENHNYSIRTCIPIRSESIALL